MAQSLGGEDLLKEMATHSSILAWRIPLTEEPVGYSPLGCKEWDATEHSILGRHYWKILGLGGKSGAEQAFTHPLRDLGLELPLLLRHRRHLSVPWSSWKPTEAEL